MPHLVEARPPRSGTSLAKKAAEASGKKPWAPRLPATALATVPGPRDPRLRRARGPIAAGAPLVVVGHEEEERLSERRRLGVFIPQGRRLRRIRADAGDRAQVDGFAPRVSIPPGAEPTQTPMVSSRTPGVPRGSLSSEFPGVPSRSVSKSSTIHPSSVVPGRPSGPTTFGGGGHCARSAASARLDPAQAPAMIRSRMSQAVCGAPVQLVRMLTSSMTLGSVDANNWREDRVPSTPVQGRCQPACFDVLTGG